MSVESKSWYKVTRPIFNSGFEDDEFWAYGQDGFQELLDSFLGSDVLVYDKAMNTIPRHVRAIIQQKTSDVHSSTSVRQILCNIGVLHCGQYIKDNGFIWMVSSMPDNNRIYEKAVLWKCVNSICFVSRTTGNIVTYPVYSVNSTQYGTGISEKTYLDVGDDQHLVYIPYNKETVLLDDDFRFIMDKNSANPTVYRITRVDTVSYAIGDENFDDGLIQWAVQEDQFNEATDSREKMVADYIEPKSGGSEVTVGVNATITLTDLDGDFTVAIGEQKQIRVDCVDNNGNAVPGFTYRLEYDIPEGAATVEETDGIITIQATDDNSSVGEQIVIRAISDDLGCDAVIRIQIVNW